MATKKKKSKQIAAKQKTRNKKNEKVRYAVIGMGHIAQAAVLPSFKNAKNSELVSLISGDTKKLKQLADLYGVPEENLLTYDDYPQCLEDLNIDAVYVALPNHLHTAACIDAMEVGCHVLCEKPLALTVSDCREMQQIAEEYNLKFMTAYRLHFEPSNLEAIKLACEKNKLGDLRVFNSTFTMQVKDDDNIRLNPISKGGGPLWDIGIYCLNAARGLFRSEPIEVFAFAANNGEERFAKIDEAVSVIMKFPNARLASFVCSFGADDCSSFDLIGSEGRLHLENAYEYADERILTMYKENKEKKNKTFKKNDQFGPELVYFSDCILQNKDPEPSFAESIADIRVIRAILKSLDAGQSVRLKSKELHLEYPQSEQLIERPPISKPRTFNVTSPSGN